jgi:hypothetical protein
MIPDKYAENGVVSKYLIFYLCFVAEPQRHVFVRQSRMYKGNCGIAASKECVQVDTP